MNLQGFNANEVEPAKPFEPLPAGLYPVCIVESQEKPTKSGTGSYLELKLQVLTGAHEGRKLFSRLNLNNPSEQAAAIARGELSAICRAVGKPTPNDSSELHNLPMVVKVSVDKDANGNFSNRIRSYHPDGFKGEAVPSAKANTTTTTNAAKPAGVASWMKK